MWLAGFALCTSLGAQEPPACEGPATRDAAWTPDMGSLVFTSNRSGGYDLWVLDLGTHELRRLTDTEADEFYPRISPDGSWVAFTQMQDGSQWVGLVDFTGGPVRAFTDAEDDAADPEWLPDGRLVFSSARGGSRDLWVSDLDGARAERLFSLEGEEWAPRISPDGERIAFHANPEGDYDVFTVRLDGSDLRNLTGVVGYDGIPAWSPDGSEVAYYHREPSVGGQTSWPTAEIRVTGAGGGGVPRDLTRNQHRDQSPSWSPDGTRIAFTSCVSGNLEIWTTDPSGADQRQVTHALPASDQADRTPSARDSAQVVDAVATYVRGWREGNVPLLRQALAPEGVILWTGDEGLQTMTFEDALARRRPNEGYGVPWRLGTVRIIDGRVATVEVEIRRESLEYTDMLTLYKIDGRWMIVAKAYTFRRPNR